MSRILIVDGKDQHKDEPDAFVVPPTTLRNAEALERAVFDAAYIYNTPTDYITSNALFHIFRGLRPGATLEVNVYQPIKIMQELDAAEIEANATVGGFDNVDTKAADGTLRITMKKP